MDLIYIWQDANANFRSKVKRIEPSDSGVLNIVNVNKYNKPIAFHQTGKQHYQIPTWNYDGSSTGQASTEKSEVLLQPYKYYLDLENDRIYVLCSTYTPEHIPVPPNNRYVLEPYEQEITQAGMKIGFEQEFFVFDTKTKDPIFWGEQGAFYCGVGGKNHTLESMVREVYKRACKLGVKCTGYNLEVAPSQAKIQVCTYAIDACHDLIFLRYLLWDTLGNYGCYPVFDPKPLGPNYNGSGLHTNVSTVYTISQDGYEKIKMILKRLEETHSEHLAVYGKGNEARLTGQHETSSMDTFTWGVGSRNTSVRIPYNTEMEERGYFEDRRPAANADPYLVCERMWKTIKSLQ